MHDKILGSSIPPVMALAYLGDSVFETAVRRRLIERGLMKSGELNKASLAYVTAENQSRIMHRIEPLLAEDERDVFRRAANSPHLNRPKHASVTDYRFATGFEALLGMLSWIKDDERLTEILELALEEGLENDTQN
ncbi:MAG: Mini-ribonuclease 3 [Clostridia bacterium]|nr:Mini-ribonuclease 3 [Clostridia bacterium]